MLQRIVTILPTLLRFTVNHVIRAANALLALNLTEVRVAFVDAEVAARVLILYIKRNGLPDLTQ